MAFPLRRRVCVFAAALVLAGHAFGQQPQPANAQPANNCSASGTVVNAITGEPIARAVVTLGDFHGGTSTDAKGEWSITGQRCGSAHLTATHAGFFSDPDEQQSGRTVELVSGTPAGNLKITLKPESIISGIVQDENGDPVEGAAIYLRRVVVTNGFRTLTPEGFNVVSGSQGDFRVDRLPPGRYIVCAQTTRRTYPVGGGAPLLYASDCYPGPLSGGSSIAVPVDGGRELHVGLTLRSTPGVHVRGTVSGIPSGKSSLVNVGLSSSVGPGGGTNPDANGSFDVAAVPPGSYILFGMLQGSGGYTFGGETIEVGGSDVSGLHLSFESAGSVTGTVRGVITNQAKNNRSPTAWVYVHLMPLSGTGSLNGVEQTWNDSHTSFTLPHIANGSYILTDIDAAHEEVFYIKSATLNSQDVLTHPFTVNGPTGPIEIVVSDDRGALTATVTNSDGQPVPGTIVLKPASGKAILITSGDDGRIARSIPVGDYKAWAFEDATNIPYNEEAWMTDHAGAPQTFTVSSSGSANIALKRIPAATEP